jgi:hypothetical protein
MLLLPEGGKDFFITPSPLGERGTVLIFLLNLRAVVLIRDDSASFPRGGKDFFITPSPLGERVGVRGDSDERACSTAQEKSDGS